MSASKALEHIRRHGTSRDVQTALYYVTRGRTAHLLELAHSVSPPPVSEVPSVRRAVAPPPPIALVDVVL